MSVTKHLSLNSPPSQALASFYAQFEQPRNSLSSEPLRHDDQDAPAESLKPRVSSQEVAAQCSPAAPQSTSSSADEARNFHASHTYRRGVNNTAYQRPIKDAITLRSPSPSPGIRRCASRGIRSIDAVSNLRKLKRNPRIKDSFQAVLSPSTSRCRESPLDGLASPNCLCASKRHSQGQRVPRISRR